jgi:NADPH-dependent 2,4-dienoyl-CoA reductase/sulfur reductase-like enzyme
MVFPETGLGARVYPADLSQFVTRYYQEKGVEIHSGMEIQAIDRQGTGFVLRGKDGKTVQVDHIIAGIGIQPNTGLAQAAGITIGGPEAGSGILVDTHLRTNQPDIYAAGDVAAFHNSVLGRTMRVEHEDNANSMGRTAGLNMAGRAVTYDHQPFFYSDLFDLGYEAVGELDPRLETVADWKDPFRQGVIYYRKDDRVRGVLLWNTWDQVDAARKLIAEGKIYRPEALKGLLPEH